MLELRVGQQWWQLRQENCYQLEASLGYVVRLFLTLTRQVEKKRSQATITNGMRGENNEDLNMKREFLFTH